jgi:hypothetical protein
MVNVDSGPTLTSVTFSYNLATTAGGGMRNLDSTPMLTDITLSNNTAGFGGGMYNEDSSPALNNLTFSANSANYGGGMYNADSSPTLTDVAFSGNSATNNGGGMVNGFSYPTLTNVTLSGNTAAVDGGAMYNTDNSTPLIQNTVLWGNSAGGSGDSILNNTSSDAPTIRFSLIEGGLPQFSVDGGNNSAEDPLFVRAVDCGADGCGDDPSTPGDESANDDYGDLRLLGGSPAIDAGDNNADLDGSGGDALTISDVATDLDGAPRIAAVQGVAEVVDMGAYERANASPVFTSSPLTDATEESPYS